MLSMVTGAPLFTSSRQMPTSPRQQALYPHAHIHNNNNNDDDDDQHFLIYWHSCHVVLGTFLQLRSSKIWDTEFRSGQGMIEA